MGEYSLDPQMASTGLMRLTVHSRWVAVTGIDPAFKAQDHTKDMKIPCLACAFGEGHLLSSSSL